MSGIVDLRRFATFCGGLVILLLAFGYYEHLLATQILVAESTPHEASPAIASDFWKPSRSQAFAFLSLAIVQCLALAVVLISFERRATQVFTIAVVAASTVLVVISMNARATTSSDPYMYMVFAKSVSANDSYVPASLRVEPGFEELKRRLQAFPSIRPSPYGPLWIAMTRIVLRGAKTPKEAYAALRIENLVFLAAFFAGLVLSRIDPRIVVLAALDPAFYHYVLVEPHNDIQGLALISLGSAAIVHRYVAVGTLVAGLSGLIKIVFVLPAIVATAGMTPLWLSLSIVAEVALGSLAGGHAYMHGLSARADAREVANAGGHIFAILEAVAAIVAFASTALFLLRKKLPEGSIWTFPALGINHLWPWYTLWAIPVAVRVPAAPALVFFVLHPIVTLFLYHPIPISIVGSGVNSILLVLAIGYALYSFRSAARVSASA